MSDLPSPQPTVQLQRTAYDSGVIVLRTKILFVVICVTLLLIEGWQAWKAYRAQLHDADTTISNMAQALAQQGDDTLKAADIILTGVIETVEAEGVTSRNKARLHQLLRARVAELPQLAGLYVLDAAGNILVDSQDQPFKGNVSARAYFQHHRQFSERTPFIGPLVKNSGGAWRLSLSRRIDNADGSFGGVMVAGIDIAYFRNFYDSFGIGKDGIIALGLNNGTLLMRRPFLEHLIGFNMNEEALFRDYISKNHHGTHTFHSGIDGKERLNAYHHFNQFPLFISVALCKEEVLDSWFADTWRHTAALLLLIALLALLGNWLLRQIELRQQTEEQLRLARDDLDQLNQHLQNLALEDSLTGMSNRRHFDSALSQEFSRALRNGEMLALILLDVDWFKQYNDLYGHRAGDECLRRIAAYIKTVPHRVGDIAARYGGEEMAILLPHTSLNAAAMIGERIRQGILALDLPHAASPLTIVTISVGVAVLRPSLQSEDPEQLVEEADRALYIAKAKGRNCVARQDAVKLDTTDF
jgi:diguanylate cyclase (GGDEF)-like protein